MSSKLKVNIIAGPTGSGKSTVADYYASKSGMPIVVADRLQCFTDIPITTARTLGVKGVSRHHLCDRTIPDGDYPADEAFADLMCLIDKLANSHHQIILEGGSISLLSCLASQKEPPFQLSVHVMPLGEKGVHWQRLRTRALKMLCPDDGGPGTLQELSRAWLHERQQPFVATINGFEAILAWCQRNGVGPSRLGEHPPTEQGLTELAVEIANAHFDHSLEQNVALRDLFGEPSSPGFSSFSISSINQSVTLDSVRKQTFNSTVDQNRNPRITVYCGARTGNSPAYTEATVKLGKLLAAADIDIVYGGGGIGLMGVLANTMLDSGGKVHGVAPRPMIEYELAHSELTTMHITETMHERKALMAQLGDAFLALPGGIGTAEELLEILTWGQLGIHNKPCVLLNTEGFFSPLIELLHHFVSTKFMSAMDAQQLVAFSEPMAAVDFLRQALLRHQPVDNTFTVDVAPNVIAR